MGIKMDEWTDGRMEVWDEVNGLNELWSVLDIFQYLSTLLFLCKFLF